MGGILEYNSLSEYRKKQWQRSGSKTQYHTSKVTLIPKQLHVQWRLQQVGTTIIQAKKAQNYNTCLIQLALSCCAAWGYLFFTGASQIKAKSESLKTIDQKQVYNQGTSEFDDCHKQFQNNGVINEEVYLDTCCQDDDVSIQDIRKILKRGENNEIDDLLDDQNDNDEIFFRNENCSISPTQNFNFLHNQKQITSFWGGNVSRNVQYNNYQQLYRQSYHNVAVVRYGSYGSQLVFLLPKIDNQTDILEQEQEQQIQFQQKDQNELNEDKSLPKKRSRLQFVKRKTQPQTIFYGIPSSHKEISEEFLDFYFHIGEQSRKQLINAVIDIPEINQQKLMETVSTLKSVLRLENQTEALKSIIKNPQVLKLNSILLKQRLKYWIVSQNIQNSRVLIAKNPSCLEIPLLDVENAINYLWKKGINNGQIVIIQNSNFDWVTFKDVEKKLNQFAELFGKRYYGYLISSAPWLLQVDLKLIQKNILFFQNLGFDETQIVQIFKSSNQHLLKRFVDKNNDKQTFQILLSYGLNESDVKDVIVQNPIILQKDLKSREQSTKLSYCEKYFSCDKKEIVKQCPQLFQYSLSEKIAARLEFLKSQKIDIRIEDLSRYLVNVSDEDFASLCDVSFDEYKQFLEGEWQKQIWPNIQHKVMSQNDY